MSLTFSALVSGVSPEGYPILHEVACENGMSRDHMWLPRRYGPGFARMRGQRVRIRGYYERYRRGGWQIRDIEQVEVVP
jgi:hypothetical protein